MKATNQSEVRQFTDIPNVGPRMAEDLRRLGIVSPVTLARHDPYTLYRKLAKITGTRQDPCVLDTFMAVVDFIKGASARPWYWYTPERKKLYPKL